MRKKRRRKSGWRRRFHRRFSLLLFEENMKKNNELVRNEISHQFSRFHQKLDQRFDEIVAQFRYVPGSFDFGSIQYFLVVLL